MTLGAGTSVNGTLSVYKYPSRSNASNFRTSGQRQDTHERIPKRVPEKVYKRVSRHFGICLNILQDPEEFYPVDRLVPGLY